jgi:acylphosphatase
LWLYFAAQNGMLQGRQRMQIFYSGRVQGVGFRYTTKKLARGYELTGTVRNLPDGRVELVAEGAREELEAFRTGVQESELGNFIRNEEIHWGEVKNEYRGFEIVR